MSKLIALGLALLVVSIAATSGVLVAFMHPERASGGADTSPLATAVLEKPLVLPPAHDPGQPYTKAPVTVLTGPSEGYAFVASLPRGRTMDVIGRDDSGAWLAVELGAGTLTGWVEASSIGGVEDVPGLAVARATPVETPSTAPPPAAGSTPLPQGQASRGGSRRQDGSRSQPDRAEQRAIQGTCRRLEAKHFVTREEWLYYREYCLT